jgi:hypothetical protein
MGVKRILLWFLGGILPCVSVLRQISNREVSFHLIVSRDISPF